MQAAYALVEALMLQEPRNMAAGVAALMDLHYTRDLLPGTSTAMLPPHGTRHASRPLPDQ